MRLRHRLHPLIFSATFSATCCALSFALGACQEDAPATPPPPPQEILPSPEPTPSNTPTLTSPELLAEVRPRLRNDADLSWGRRHSSIPGHYGAWLVGRDKRPVLLLSVDDLLHAPERRAWLRARPLEILPGLPADVSTGHWIRALVADRYEVSLTTQGAHLGDHAILLEWFEKLNLKPLLPEPPRP